MHKDNSNPFQKLAAVFAGKKTRSAGAGGKDEPRRKRPEGETKSRNPLETEGTDEQDAALFLNAVSQIKLLAVKKRKEQQQGAGPLAQALVAGMKTAAARVEPLGQGEKQGGTALGAHQKGVSNPGFSDDSARFLAAMGTAVTSRPEKRESAPLPGLHPLPGADGGGGNDETDALFAKAMQGVAPVGGKGRDVVAAVASDKRMPKHDPSKALREVLEGKVEFALHHTNEYIEGFVVGVDPLVLERLRAGHFSPEKHLDLHGMNAEQAYDALIWFVKDAYQKGLRTLVVVTGRGKNSPDGIGVLRPMLQHWLCREPFKRVVLAFCTARPHDGGAGAVYILLRKYKKSRGKIFWERMPSSDDFFES